MSAANDYARRKVSQPFVQKRGPRAGQTYRVTRGLSGAAVRVYNPLGGRPQTARIAGTLPSTVPPKIPDSGLTRAASAKHGGQDYLYRRGVSGKLIPVRKA